VFRRLRESLRRRPTGSSAALPALAALPVRITAAGSRPLVYSTTSGSAHLLSPGAPISSRSWRAAGRCGAIASVSPSTSWRGRGLVISREALLQELLGAADFDAPSRIASVAWLTRGPACGAGAQHPQLCRQRRPARTAPPAGWCSMTATRPGRQTLEALRPLAAEASASPIAVLAKRPAWLPGSSGRPAELSRRMSSVLRCSGCRGTGRPAALTGTARCSPSSVRRARGDDDTVCEPAPPPRRRRYLVDHLRARSERPLCHDDRQSLLASVTRADADFLAAHESLLGRSAGGCAQQWPADRIDLDAVSPALAELLVRGGGRVMVTTAGTYGDAIVGDPTALLWSDGDAPRRIVVSEERFFAAFAS